MARAHSGCLQCQKRGQPRAGPAWPSRAPHLIPEPCPLATPQYHTECISGCVCPEGLIDDGRGGCVKEEACPCVHNKELYSPGHTIKVDCNTW